MEEEEPLQPRGNPMRPRRVRPLTSQVLRELFNKQPVEILVRLASDGGGLDQLLRDISMDNDRLLLFLQIIHKTFTRQNLQFNREQIRCIINSMVQTEFLNFTVLNFLVNYVAKFSDERKMILAAVLALVDFSLIILPQFAYPKVHQFPAQLREMLREVPDADLAIQLGRINAEIDQCKQGSQRAREVDHHHGNRSGGLRFHGNDERPTDAFRALALIPTHEDLIADDEIFIRPNRENGQYTDLEDYLDVQFRLFRADFIIPLRESINKYLGAHGAEAIRESGQGIKVYRDVQIMRPVCTDKYLAYRISFDVTAFTSVDWATTQRLKFGSLLCLSHDNFQTYLCAVVLERSVPLMSNGLVDVVFVLERHELDQVIDLPRDQSFVMVESPAYFEAYRPVLQGLKNLNDHNFPFIPYIVQCQAAVDRPEYLRQGNVKYDFQPLLDDAFKIDDEDRTEEDVGMDSARRVDVVSFRDWPTREDLKLDVTQYEALHSALTKEFAMVQGPPGTGKTYLGLKIMKMLLHNSHAWNDPREKRPILVVCYTNHALDQFLEGIMDFFKGSLVRVGSRSSSERLKDMNLSHYRKRAKAVREIPMEVHEARLRAKLELHTLRIDIHEKAAKLEIVQQEIVKEDFLKDLISQSCIDDFKRSLRKEEESGMLKWLKLELLKERVKYQAEHREKNLPPHKAVARSHSHTPYADLTSAEDFEDDLSDDDETLDISLSLRDGAGGRELDIDDDEDFFEDLDLNPEFEVEETDMDRLRRRQKEMEQENRLLRSLNVVLDVTGFCEGADREELWDRTCGKADRGKAKEVTKDFCKLMVRQKGRLQAMLRSADRMTMEEEEQVKNIWDLKMKDRWRLYRFWTDLYCRQIRGEIREQERNYFDKARKYREILHQEDRSILEKQTVIGMTTTGAARYQSVLHEIGPKVIVVEEAAEVFEAHVVATLSRQCQHLILIGDHKQLRPNPTVYDLAKKGNLDISLFERMIRNGLPFNCLGYQHRMRPEISRMMTLPELYPKLQDHEVVKNMAPVKGISHNVFYISHSSPEQRDDETKSYSNAHEALYMAALCDYLLKQGYSRQQITILTPYSGQIRALGRELPRRQFEGVKISSVDNFQGEENDIILLSLVRSNNDNDIGFLKYENRVCVALSRAKMGLYILGNFETLQNSNAFWASVVDSARAQGILGTGLPLSCQNHPRQQGIVASSAEDFTKAPEGGCKKQCDVRLECGHRCQRTCHPNEAHAPCPAPCSRACQVCDQMCDGDHACRDHNACTRWTEKVIPRCGHTQMMACGTSPMTVDCRKPCTETLACGHPCQNTCGQPCTRQCQTVVEAVSAQCGHSHRTKCSQRDTAPCSHDCKQELVCGHVCKGSCGSCRRGRLHVQCGERCMKILVCGHDCPAVCCQCPPCVKPCQNRCGHSRCDKKCGEPCVPCAELCEWQCAHQKCSRQCGEPCNRGRCDEPCKKKLPQCGHPCPGLCGEKCPPICVICTPDILNNLVLEVADSNSRLVYLEDCGHMEEATSLDRWVDQSREFQTPETDDSEISDEGEGESSGRDGRSEKRVVKFPECPQCKTPIRRNLRYGNVIKEALMEMEIIKQRCRGDETKVETLLRKVEQVKTRVPQCIKPKVDALFKQDEIPNEAGLATKFYQITMATDANHLLQQVLSAMKRWPDMSETYTAVERDLQQFITWTTTPRLILSSQEHFDVRIEFERLTLIVHLLHCRHAISQDKLEVAARIMRRLAASIRRLMSGEPITESDLQEGRQLKEELKDIVVCPYGDLSDEEREEIVRAISLPTGSWYACPRGHYYVIGECGRPTELASCPECRSTVGGESHALAEGNRLAPEFDNAEGPRWSVEEDERFARMLQEQEFENWR